MLVKDFYLKDFAFFLCQKNSKIPATKNGYKSASFCFNIQAAFDNGFNVGFPMSVNGLIAIDEDYDESKGYNGIQTICNLEKTLGTLPQTYTQRTPRGGYHRVFSAKGINQAIGKIGKDVDVKLNGYILLAGSKINGKYYVITDGFDKNGKITIAELPAAWLDYLNKDEKITSSEKSDYTELPKRTYSEVNIEKIFQNCAFLRHCKDNAEELSYNEWFSMITILAQIDDSDDLIHELSEPYLKYSYSETQKVINEAKKFGRPHTCKYISSSFQDVCTGCISAVKKEEIK